jgi:hypothetical protein
MIGDVVTRDVCLLFRGQDYDGGMFTIDGRWMKEHKISEKDICDMSDIEEGSKVIYTLPRMPATATHLQPEQMSRMVSNKSMTEEQLHLCGSWLVKDG